jgi:hypothetical protein
VTVVLSCFEVVLVTTAKTPTVAPGVTSLGLTVILIPKSEPWAFTGNGTVTSVKHASARKLFIKYFLIDSSPSITARR